MHPREYFPWIEELEQAGARSHSDYQIDYTCSQISYIEGKTRSKISLGQENQGREKGENLVLHKSPRTERRLRPLFMKEESL